MHIEEFGLRNAPAALLLHGHVEGGSIYRQLAERLSASRRVLVPDLPGYGPSPLLQPYAMNAVRAALLQELETRQVSRVSIVGFSMGAHHATGLTLDRPQLVDALVLLGPVVGLDAEERGQFAAFRDMMAGPAPMTAFDDLLVQRWFPAAFARERSDVIARVLDAWHRAPRPTLTQEFAATSELPDLRPRLGEIRVPTLVRAGREDLAIPSGSAEAIAHAIPGARCEIVEGVGHQLLYQDAEATIASVLQHLKAS